MAEHNKRNKPKNKGSYLWQQQQAIKRKDEDFIEAYEEHKRPYDPSPKKKKKGIHIRSAF